jgi:hypothetical protein
MNLIFCPIFLHRTMLHVILSLTESALFPGILCIKLLPRDNKASIAIRVRGISRE